MPFLSRVLPKTARVALDSFGAVRELAGEKHDAIRAKAGGQDSASALLIAARKATDLQVQALPSGHPLLAGGDGALHRGSNAIYISNALEPDAAAFVEAHEFGHYWLETVADPAIVPRGSDPGWPEEAAPLGVKRVEAYSAQELRERLANVFGREFLLPRTEARRMFVDEGCSAPEIARQLGLPIGLVHQQLAVALLLPAPSVSDEDQSSGGRPGLDPSQKAAAEHQGSPLLVEAGPGTGKTRTLIARVEFLLSQGVPAAAVLALTFSNKAAREIRERVAASMPAATAELWAGTFHAFGLEILRKFGQLADITDPVRLLDQADLLAMLEQDLPQLGLDHYLRLHEPLLELRHILDAIARAKDEVKSAEDCALAAARMATVARSEEDALKAAKAAEVARVYRHYDERMRGEGLVDFADLINRPIEILRAHPEVRDELRAQYRHLLVDEYQDVNRASALLLKELAGDGELLWVVGDAPQSIYRFRGAAPINTRNFEKDYPKGQRKLLEINYRSHKEIVDTFCAYAGTMRVGRSRAVPLKAERGPGRGAVDFHVARDRDAEIAGIAAAIERRRSEGIAYREQAVLCRVHGNLEKIALGLEAAGVPVLYLGDLFERPEVRDLLALISFTAEPARGGLYRVATLVPYRTPLSDVRTFFDYAAAAERRPLDALDDVSTIHGLSAAGRAGLARLARDLASVHYKTGPGALLCSVLFDSGALLRAHLHGDTAADQQRRLAIHQFLQFAIENDRAGQGDPKRHLLNWVRRLEAFGDERALREPPAAVDGIDAVRAMTVHASKGLEFKVVHLPVLGAGMFPKKRQGERCPLPDELLPTSPVDDHEEEEECLFYVALSRARDHLSLSRAERYSDKSRSKASEALKKIAASLPRSPDGPPTWTQTLPVANSSRARADLRVEARAHDGRDLEVFLRCPQSYLYQIVLGLSGGREDNGYVRFHRALYRVLNWMGAQGNEIDATAALIEFESAWREIGPHGHPLEALYRAAADRILGQARGRSRAGIQFGDAMTLAVDGHTISIPVDEVERSGSAVVFRRLRTGRPPSRPDQRHLHALMLQAGRQTMGQGGRFELQYLTTNETVRVELDGVMAARLADIRAALQDLAAGRFLDLPKSREDCPLCPHYFVCPALPS
jgi:superfamily I DNA/RNA helicase/Zn-dependent peptidase ImmA (M78 family)